MDTFDLLKISDLTKKFIQNKKALAYDVEILEATDQNILIKAENLFSSLFCQITENLSVIRNWVELQRTLFQTKEKKINQYLVFIIPQKVIAENNLYRELTLAEGNEYYFRKIFIEIPEKFSKKELENSLMHRIPIWTADKNRVLSEFIPNIESLVNDQDLISLIERNDPKSIISELNKNKKFGYLFKHSDKSLILHNDVQEIQAINTSENKISSLQLTNFRCFENLKIDFKYDITLIYGKNGRGKTSIAEALEFAIFNEVSRLRFDPDLEQSSNKYLPLIHKDSVEKYSNIKLNGISKGKEFEFSIDININGINATLNDNKIENQDFLKYITNSESKLTNEYRDILLHTHFLTQNSIRDFIYGDKKINEDELRTRRYDLVLEMFGFGRMEKFRNQMTKLIASIKRYKVTGSNKILKNLESQIRGLKQKYGPKAHKSVFAKGYEVNLGSGSKLIGNILARLSELDPKTFNIYQSKNDITYNLNSLSNLKNNINSKLNEFKTKSQDYKILNQHINRIVNIFSYDLSLISFKKIDEFVAYTVSNINDKMNFVATKNLRFNELIKEIQVFENKKSKLKSFLSIHPQYLANLKSLDKLKIEIESINQQRQVNDDKLDLLNEKKKTLLIDSETKEEEYQYSVKIVKEINELRLQFNEYEKNKNELFYFRKNIYDNSPLNFAPYGYQDSVRKLNIILKRMIDEQNTLKLNSNNCPCCGQNYVNESELLENILTQLNKSDYKNELMMFVYSILLKSEELSSESIDHLKILINNVNRKIQLDEEIDSKLKSYEKACLQYFNRLPTQIQDFDNKLEDIASNQKILINYRKKIQELDSEINLITNTQHSLKPESLQKEINKLQRYIDLQLKDIISIESMDNLTNIEYIQASYNSTIEKIESLNMERESIEGEIKELEIITNSQNEIFRIINEIEHIYIKYNINETIIRNLVSAYDEDYQLYKNILVDVQDAIKIYGILHLNLTTDAFEKTKNETQIEQERWTNCYNNLNKIKEILDTKESHGLKESLRNYNPLINEIYEKFIRHDRFSKIELKTKASRKYKKKNLYLKLVDFEGNSDSTPTSYLSESQLNILALSIFISRVIYQNISGLQTIIIDDPIQQMDDMNSTSLIDIIIGLSFSDKQLIIMTCDEEFFNLFKQKLSVLNNRDGKARTFQAINLDLIYEDSIIHKDKLLN